MAAALSGASYPDANGCSGQPADIEEALSCPVGRWRSTLGREDYGGTREQPGGDGRIRALVEGGARSGDALAPGADVNAASVRVGSCSSGGHTGSRPAAARDGKF